MRATTAFKWLLRLPGASIIDVGFGAEGVIVIVKLRRRRRICSRCGQTSAWTFAVAPAWTSEVAPPASVGVCG